VNTTLRYLNVSICCSVFPLTCRKHCLGRLKRHNTSIFLELIFVLSWSHAEENPSNASWRPCYEDQRMQYQFVRKNQTVHPAVPNSNTLVEVSMTVYYSYRPALLQYFGRDHISYCTTLRASDNMRHVIFSGCVTFYQISTFFVKIFFIIGKMRFAAGWNGLAGRIWPAGRSVENPDIDYEEKWWQHTPLSESNTNAERLWVNSVYRDTIFWTGI